MNEKKRLSFKSPQNILTFFVLLGMLVGIISGCATLSVFRPRYKYIKPTVAVFKFDNRAPFPLKWSLGEGMSDLMVSNLVRTDRYSVLEREDLKAVLGEINLQNFSQYTRPQGKIPLQRLKNCQYLIKGTLTDFTHTIKSGFGIGYKWLRVGGGGKIALVSMVITVIDVESGEIIFSRKVSANAYAGTLDVAGTYKNVAFVGDVFISTPLGKATERAMRKAIKGIDKAIARRYWHPVVNTIDGDWVVLNGGKNRHVKVGQLYAIFIPGQDIFDINTGDYLGRTPGTQTGVVQVKEVFEQYSNAKLIDGNAGEVGYRMKKLTFNERKKYTHLKKSSE